jgi:hypothetical protein
MALIKTIIKINGLYYAGEGLDTYNSTSKGSGWLDYKSNEVNYLKFVNELEGAYITEGNRNLKSILDKIIQRVQDQEIQFDTIEIIKLTENRCKDCGKVVDPCGCSVDNEGNYLCFDCDEEIINILKEIL